jgi:hypothetical protein
MHSPLKLSPQSIQDLSLIAAYTSSVSGKEISPRLLKHFSTLVLPHPPQSALCTVFQVMYLALPPLPPSFHWDRTRFSRMLCTLLHRLVSVNWTQA